MIDNVDEENFPIRGRGIKVPEDPVTLVDLNCKNYQEKVGVTTQTRNLGQRIQIEYDAKIIGKKSKGAFDITLTSYGELCFWRPRWEFYAVP